MCIRDRLPFLFCHRRQGNLLFHFQLGSPHFRTILPRFVPKLSRPASAYPSWISTHLWYPSLPTYQKHLCGVKISRTFWCGYHNKDLCSQWCWIPSCRPVCLWFLGTCVVKVSSKCRQRLFSIFDKKRKAPNKSHKKSVYQVFIWLGWRDSNPRDAGVKVLCLTAWRQPNIQVRYRKKAFK